MSQIRIISALTLAAAFTQLGSATPQGSAESTIPKNSILPVALTTDLTSAVSKVGDKFTARILTHGTDRYGGLPFGSVVYGTVNYVKRLEGESAGLLELEFFGIETPSGQRIPISGQLCELDGKSITKAADGVLSTHIAARSRVFFAGYGKFSHQIVGVNFVNFKDPITDADISRLVAKEVGLAVTKAFSGEVQLPADSKFGVQLLKPLSFPKDVM